MNHHALPCVLLCRPPTLYFLWPMTRLEANRTQDALSNKARNQVDSDARYRIETKGCEDRHGVELQLKRIVKGLSSFFTVSGRYVVS